MSLDREAYRRDVLDPARQRGNVLPADLYQRYGLPGGSPGPADFTQHVREVSGYWQELRSTRTYGLLARNLIDAHAELERTGPLTLHRLALLHRNAREEQRRRLEQLARAMAGAASHVGPGTIRRLRDELTVHFTDAEIAGELARAGVTVVDPLPALPVAQHPKQADLAQNVQRLGRQLSPEVVFGDEVRGGFRVLGGFRLADGRQLDEAALAAARLRAAAQPHTDAAREPTENVLAILSGAVRRPGDLDALLLSEVAGKLRQLADAAFPHRAVAARARDLGLAADEAGPLAAALLGSGSASPPAARYQQLASELAAGRLRSAQQLAMGLPRADAVHGQLSALDARVTDLRREADEALAGGHSELAAVRLVAALRIAGDDPGLARQLAELPPPAPLAATATAAGGEVVVVWEAVPGLAGRLRYRVMRGTERAPASAASGTEVIAGTTGTEVTDAGAPPGAALFYSVFAGWGTNGWSPPAVTRPLVLAPDVTDVCVTAVGTSVAISWQAPPSADTVQAVRAAGRTPQGPADGTPVAASLTGFRDTGLRTGTEYRYRITVWYRAGDGQRRASAGIVVPAVPAPEPEAVTDLAITVAGDGASTAVASWTPPRSGEVRLAVCGAPPPWPPGTRITPQEAAGLREIPGVPRRDSDGRDVLELKLPSGRYCLISLTSGNRTVVVGNTAAAVLLEPARCLTAERLHDSVRLAWEWPSGATGAVIRWAGREHRCSRRSYDDDGGVTVTAGPAETLVEVCLAYPDPGGALSAPAAVATVPARGIAVHYRIRRGGLFRRRRRTVAFAAERATRLPALLIVQAAGAHPPEDPAGGEMLAQVAPQPIAPSQPVAVTVGVRKGPGWLACFADPGTPAADVAHIVLFPPPRAEMRIR